MSNLKSIKYRISEAILAEISNLSTLYYDASLDEVIFDWWYTGRRDGLRLTDNGDQAFQLANIEYHNHTFVQSGMSFNSFILELNKKIKCPYYIGVNKETNILYIRLYDSKISMMLALYGSLREYLESIKLPNHLD